MIEKLLGIEISLAPNMEPDEIEQLVEAEEACYLARQCFIQGKISLEDLMDIYEMTGVSIDDFLKISEENLSDFI